MLPYGWTASDVAAGISVARNFKADPRDIFALWYHEGGLNPRIHPFGDYYGLIGGSDAMVSPVIGASWSNIASNGTIIDQLRAIQLFWEAGQRKLGESYAARASRIGTTPAAMIYAMNFVPAYAARVSSADGVLISGADPLYADNPVFDTNHKGYISIRDLENKIAAMRLTLAKNATFAGLYAMLPGLSVVTPAVLVVAALGVSVGIAYYLNPGLFRPITRRLGL